jgi:hypothetical protein
MDRYRMNGVEKLKKYTEETEDMSGRVYEKSDEFRESMQHKHDEIINTMKHHEHGVNFEKPHGMLRNHKHPGLP